MAAGMCVLQGACRGAVDSCESLLQMGTTSMTALLSDSAVLRCMLLCVGYDWDKRQAGTRICMFFC
jgi:hypothetical protein